MFLEWIKKGSKKQKKIKSKRIQNKMYIIVKSEDRVIGRIKKDPN